MPSPTGSTHSATRPITPTALTRRRKIFLFHPLQTPWAACVYTAPHPLTHSPLNSLQLSAHAQSKVCVHACTCTCTYVRVHVHIRTCTCAYVHVHVHIRTCTCVCMYMYGYSFNYSPVDYSSPQGGQCLHTYMYMYMYIYSVAMLEGGGRLFPVHPPHPQSPVHSPVHTSLLY